MFKTYTEETLEVIRGDNLIYESILKEGINGVSSVINLTDATIRLTVRQIKSSPAALIEMVSPTHITITDAVNGKADFNFIPATTNSIEPGEYIHDVEVTISGGRIITCNIGKFILIADITRPAP